MVSVIIPYYNAKVWITRTIESCLIQGEYLKEIIIIDDFSNEEDFNTLLKLEKKYYGVVKVFKNKTKGANSARNYGFEIATGEYIQWLDADDELIEGKFATQIDFLRQHANIDVAYSDWKQRHFNASNVEVNTVINTTKNYDDYLEELLKNNWLALHTYLFKKSAIEKVIQAKGWNEIRMVSQDREFVTFCAALGLQFGYVKGCFCIYNKFTNASLSRRNSDFRHQEVYEILENTEMLLGENKKYRDIIYTQKLICIAFNNKIKPKSRIPKFKILWNLISGIRTKIRVIITYYKMVKFYE